MLVPALLTDERAKLVEMLRVCESFAQCVQIDIMDSEFVPSSSISIEDLKGIKYSKASEAHLMVCDPLAWLDAFKAIGSFRIIYHYEIDADHNNIIKTIKKRGFHAGLAVNPDTKIDDFSYLVPDLDVVLFMSVVPGFYGAKFIPPVLDKIKEFKKIFPNVYTSIDGGVKLDNISDIKSTGVNDICVGSAILKSDDPAKAFNDLNEVINV